ncbi:DegT/DnrJ/EryC1/StrS family aminotransferase [Ancylobacter sp.]|uniref:DegT/DnrJ/EryC1/StrS family aminotransferase n=1 Tax=Ancylobacter sp. TaxID=1872567 RepID=UPI003D0FCF8B
MKQELSNRLAIDGGVPVRTRALPYEFPGANWIGDEERELVDRVVTARSPFRFYGEDSQHMVETLEREWCAVFGHRHAVAVASATSGLSIAMSALGIGPGDEVLLPGYLWVSCVAAVVRSGAIPRLVDVDDTFCLDPASIERAIGPRSRAVLAVHMNGAPGRIREIAAICARHGIPLIEDCAQAAGASSGGTAVGRFGAIGVFSFQLNKNMTSGEGGMVVCEDPALHRRIVALHDLGYARNESGRLDTGDETCQLWGYGVRMSELAGALALAQLRKLPRIATAMRTAKWRIREAVSTIPGLGLRSIPCPEGDTGPFLITLLRDEDTARRFAAAVHAEGIAGPDGRALCVSMRDWGLHWYSNIPSLVRRTSNSRDGFPWSHPANAFAADYAYGAGALPFCDDLHARGVVLSIGSTLAEPDVDDIIVALRKVAHLVLS